MNKPLVIYHGGCADGVAAAWCFWKVHGDDYEYFPGVHGNNDSLPSTLGREVYFVDFCYPNEVMSDICFTAKSVVVLDHHTSTMLMKEKLNKFSNCDTSNCSEETSGAILAWRYVSERFEHDGFNTDKSPIEFPSLLNYIADRDLWLFKLEHTKEIIQAVYSYNLTFKIFDELTKKSIHSLYEEGVVLKRNLDKNVKSLSYMARYQNFAGFDDIPVVNAPYFMVSELGNYLCKDKPFSVVYYDSPTNRVFGLRSNKDGIDVSKIAMEFGGGGHVHAAGFSIPLTTEV